MEKREAFAIEEGLHQAIVIKLSSGAPDLKDLRTLLPKHLGIKDHCLIGSLAPRQLFIWCDQYDDYVIAFARSMKYFSYNGKDHQYRIFSWSTDFNYKKETTKAAVWISLPNLALDLFVKRLLLSIAAAVEKPIAIGKATQVKSRPSTARIKVIPDLLEKLLKRIRFRYLDNKTGGEGCEEAIREKIQGNMRGFLNEKRGWEDGDRRPHEKNQQPDLLASSHTEVEVHNNVAKLVASNVDSQQQQIIANNNPIGDVDARELMVQSGENSKVLVPSSQTKYGLQVRNLIVERYTDEQEDNTSLKPKNLVTREMSQTDMHHIHNVVASSENSGQHSCLNVAKKSLDKNLEVDNLRSLSNSTHFEHSISEKHVIGDESANKIKGVDSSIGKDWTVVAHKKYLGIRIGSPARINVQLARNVPYARASSPKEISRPNTFDLLSNKVGHEINPKNLQCLY
ncbi:hypothetical protein P3L10_018181 [Capsicum annuum]